jgi:hypothetical protein
MNAIAFQSEITNNSIPIPEQYRDALPSRVYVVVRAPSKVVPRRKEGAITAADVLSPCLSTVGWKFNRDEANER